MIDILKADLLAHVAEYLDLPNRVRIASCSKTLDRQIYRHCKSLWVVIRLERLPSKVSMHLKDGDIHLLLSKCNARQVTRTLSLRGCASLRGYMLDAVRGSHVLKWLDLRTDCSHGIPGRSRHTEYTLRDGGFYSKLGPDYKSGIFFDYQYVLDFLSSVTLQHGLIRVDLDPHDFEGKDGEDAAKCWVDNYEKACKERTRVQGLPCAHCYQLLAEVDPGKGKKASDHDESRYWKWYFYGRHQCSKCDVHSCCQGDCPKVYRCRVCRDACCRTCLDPRSSDDHHQGEFMSVCKQCAAERACVLCDFYDPAACGCTGRTLDPCWSCKMWSCTKCSISCIKCQEEFCNACSAEEKCNFCGDEDEYCFSKYCTQCAKLVKWTKCQMCDSPCCDQEHDEWYRLKKCNECKILVCYKCKSCCSECGCCEDCAAKTPCDKDCPGEADCSCKCECVTDFIVVDKGM